ncbi:MAG: phenylalanine--tRNA ligase subunit alpha [Candidatus Methanodesulfokora sp.]|nr:MAG: phenylalanine--tRNA ligase subunit alpha [Candidatus Korarchaeota archaeon]
MISLSQGEHDLLKRIESFGGKVILEDLGLEKSSAYALASLLEAKSLVRISRIRRKAYELTERGRSCLKDGMPEEVLINAAKDGKIYLDDASKLLQGELLQAAVGWLRRKGAKMGEDERGKYLVVRGIEIPEREILLEIEKGIIPENKDIVRALIKRGLVKEKELALTAVELTELGRECLEGKVPLIIEVAKLNRKLVETGEWRNLKLKRYDISALPPEAFPGKPHPYSMLLDEVREILIGMGFREVKSPFVEAEFWNFDVLFQAQDHPAREIHDSYIVSFPSEPADLSEHMDLVEKVRRAHENGYGTGSTGWGYKWSFEIARRLVLRTQTTAASARELAKGLEIPSKIFAIDRVFRPEALDKTHAMEFHQCEGVVLAEDLNVKHLLGFLAEFSRSLGFKEVKFRPAYFPFTEPSVEAYVRHEKLGWIEIAGSGLFRPEMLVPLGYDYPRIQALAWGIGIGRLAMLRMGIDDIRELHSQSLDFLRRAPL